MLTVNNIFSLLHLKKKIHNDLHVNFGRQATKQDFQFRIMLIQRSEGIHFEQLTSVAIMHSFFSSAITKTDWYTESLEEHIVDILHSGLSLWSEEHTSCQLLSTKILNDVTKLIT